MEILNIIKKIIPKRAQDFLRPSYHFAMSYLAALWYRFPSNKMIVIGVTGTNGKSSTSELIARALEGGGFKVGLTSTLRFKVGEREWLNDKKMTMLGRFELQKLLREMADAGCRYAVIETSSEGVKQFRHKGINYDYAVFTNLTPEHIESHGSFEKYKRAKLDLFKHLEKCKRKRVYSIIEERTKGNHSGKNLTPPASPACAGRSFSKRGTRENYSVSSSQADVSERIPLLPFIKGGTQGDYYGKEYIEKMIIVNGDDKHAKEFLNFKADRKIIYGVMPPPSPPLAGRETNFTPPDKEGIREGIEKNAHSIENVIATDVRLDKNRTYFKVQGIDFELNLLGKFNIYNFLPAIIIGRHEGIELNEIKEIAKKIPGIPGRMEFIKEGQSFQIIVDYAYEPEALRKVYETLEFIVAPQKAREGRDEELPHSHSRIIHVLGSCGGGRDKARRAILGELAGRNADYIIITNEDPYDDDPLEIIEEVAKGAFSTRQQSKKTIKQKKEGREISLEEAEEYCVLKILDRREAIKKALELATPGDLVLITGKGAEQAICVAHGEKIPWDDRKAVRELLHECQII